ncbi:MAG: DUF3494 domain-containing protein [Xanthomonadaceae bacterium]|nr:DUF3494 domain-containing protein [Xanthomonadaceae bacterium]
MTQTNCSISGAVEIGSNTAVAAYSTFIDEYNALATQPPCQFFNVPLAGAFLQPGVYCYDAAVVVTDSTLTLVGSASDNWIFRIGTGGTGALTGTNFNVEVSGGTSCNSNVVWWTSQAATMTDSNLVGSVLAGADITFTRGSTNGQLLAAGEVTLTDTAVDYCPNASPPAAPVIGMFVIGDDQRHAIGDTVNFWGAQWWRNNLMSGTVSPGASRASFKGYATGTLVCGGTWQALPGNSTPPPATIPDRILVVVTSSVIKNGRVINGDISEIVIVDHDGRYRPNPGHAGHGVISSVVCTQ